MDKTALSMMAKTSLQPGFRFHPTDVELVLYYLKRKLMGKPLHVDAITEIELYQFAPWDLPDKSSLQSRDREWYFFCPRCMKYASGSRTNRATDLGYWKTTGKDRPIDHHSRIIGMKKTLIFHVGKAPKGDRTDWVMYEYRSADKELANAGFSQDAYVLCKIFRKSGSGPKIGEQYGAPFNEEDWEDDTAAEPSFSLPSMSCHSPELVDETPLEPICQQSVVSGSGLMSFTPDLPVSDDTPDLLEADGIFIEQLLALLNDSPIRSVNADGKMPDSASLHKNDNEMFGVEPAGIYAELEDLTAQAGGSLHKNYNEIFGVDTEGIYDELENLPAQARAKSIDNFYHLVDMDSEYAMYPFLSELRSKDYLELNDIFGDTYPYELAMPNDLFAQNPLEHSSHFQMEDQNLNVDSILTTASVANNSLLITPTISDEQSTSISDVCSYIEQELAWRTNK
ncbi:uncharacterized protein [Typha angustifolia]|uniref:uncharacterized protein n=1 Tax=Typha angustifolia TaxID=59011 RepID=UPI003C2E521A